MLSLSSNGHAGAKDYGNLQAVFNALFSSFKKSILTHVICVVCQQKLLLKVGQTPLFQPPASVIKL